jgi:hypothetical protein
MGHPPIEGGLGMLETRKASCHVALATKSERLRAPGLSQDRAVPIFRWPRPPENARIEG